MSGAILDQMMGRNTKRAEIIWMIYRDEKLFRTTTKKRPVYGKSSGKPYVIDFGLRLRVKLNKDGNLYVKPNHYTTAWHAGEHQKGPDLNDPKKK